MVNQDSFDLTIGRLDRVLSEMMDYSRVNLDSPNRQTLKHHAEDLVAAGQAILKRLGDAQPGTPQPEEPAPVEAPEERCRGCGGLGFVDDYDGHKNRRHPCPKNCPAAKEKYPGARPFQTNLPPNTQLVKLLAKVKEESRRTEPDPIHNRACPLGGFCGCDSPRQCNAILAGKDVSL